MKKRRILLGLALASLFTFSLSACGDDAEPTTPTTDNGGNGTTPTVNKYNVTFKNGTSELTALKQQVKEGEKATKPTKDKLPTQTGKRFDYWSADGLTAFNFDSAITKDTELKAVFVDVDDYDTLAASDKKIVAADFYDDTVEKAESVSFNSNTVKISTTNDANKFTSDNKFGLNADALVFDFGDKKITSSGVLTVYFELNFSAIKNKEAFFQLDGTSAVNTDKEVFGLRVDETTKFAYRLDEGNDVSSTKTVELNTPYKAKLVIDTADGKASIELDGTVLAENIDINISEIRGIKFTAKPDGSSSTKTVDNVVATFETKAKNELAQAKDNAANELDAMTLSTDAAIAAAERAKITEAKSNIYAATTVEGVAAAKKVATDYIAATKYKLIVKAYTAAATPATNVDDYVEVFTTTETVSTDNVAFNGFSLSGLYTAEDLATEYTAGGTLTDNTTIFAKIEEKSSLVFDAAVALASYEQSAAVAKNTVFGDFKVVFGDAKRGKSSTFALEVSSKMQSALEFTIPTGKKANIELKICSTGSSNETQNVGIYKDGTTLVTNNESVTSVSGTSATTVTYSNVAAGTYDIGTTYETRGFRIISVTVSLVNA